MIDAPTREMVAIADSRSTGLTEQSRMDKIHTQIVQTLERYLRSEARRINTELAWVKQRPLAASLQSLDLWCLTDRMLDEHRCHQLAQLMA